MGGIVKDKICPNMFVDENKIAFLGKKKTKYTAHELVQLKVLFDRNDTYARLLQKNRWVKEFLPQSNFPKAQSKKNKFAWLISEKLIWPIEKIFYLLQLMYMNKSRSNEVISGKKAFFHPIDRQKLILDMYELRYKRYMEMYEQNLWIDREEARFYLDEKKIRILN